MKEQKKGEDWERFNTLAKICKRAESLGQRLGILPQSLVHFSAEIRRDL